VLLLACAVAQAGSVDPALPAYEPIPVDLPAAAGYVTDDGRVRVVGYNDMRELLEPLAGRFSQFHPGIRFDLDLRGTRFAPQSLALGASAFAPMGAEFTPEQLAEYRRMQPRDPTCFRVAHASLDPRALSGPLAVLVNAGNPVGSLTLEQVSGIYSGMVSNWGELGLSGSWRDRPIVLYGMAPGTALSYAFRNLAMGGREFDPQMRGLLQSAAVVAQVASDPAGIGFAAAMRASEGTRVVPLSKDVGSEPIPLTEANVAAGRYPLDRYLLICVARPVPAVAREFLRLILSREGQSAVAATPQRYIPLSAADAAIERCRLDQSSLSSSTCTSAAVSGK
jgi:phosphate transport system substrate-binding protein